MLPLGPKWMRLNETAGAMGMTIFFALSGFLISSNLISGQSIGTFLIRRFARILPLAYLYLGIVFFMVSLSPRLVFDNLLFIENYHQTSLIQQNSHFWSLCVEMHFYVAIALGVLLLGKRGVWLVIPACLLITSIRFLDDGGLINIKTHLRVDEILTGACVALLYRRIQIGTRRSPIFFAVVVAVAVAVTAVFLTSSPLSGDLQYLRPYCGGTLLLAALCLPECWLYKMLSSWPARYVAKISYALYVIHPLTIFGWMDEGSILERYLFKRPIVLF